MKVLQLVPRLPYPPDDGGKIGILGITNGYLALGHQVYMGGFDQEGTRAAFEANLAPHLSGHLVHSLSSFDHRRAALGALALKRPFIRDKYWSRAFFTDCVRIVEQFEPDLVHLDHSHMASYGVALKQRFPELTCVLRAHNVEYTVWQRMAANADNAVKRALLNRMGGAVKRFEGCVFSELDGILAISDVDIERIEQIAPTANVMLMPAGYSLNPPVALRRDASVAPHFAFVGFIDWAPNRDGMVWFLNNIWPSIIQRWPDAQLDVIGRNSGAALTPAPGVRHLGFVEDLASALSKVDVALVPLRIGGGMRVKILDFLSRGLPLISTTIGAEGIPCNYLGARVYEQAEDAEDFVAAAERLLHSYESRMALAATGRRLIKERYNWSALVGSAIDWISTAHPTHAG